MSFTPQSLRFAAVALSLFVLAGLSASGNARAATCDAYASTSGSDSAAGTAAAPFRSVQKLVDSLAGGGTGCLQAGTYYGNVIVRSGGTSSRPLVVTSAGNARSATVNGIVQIDDSANYVTFDSLVLDGTNPPTANSTQIMIFGDHVTLSNNEIFNGGQRICVSTGDANGNFGIAWYPVINANRIHDCGNKTLLQTYPSGHALYLEADRYAQITNNLIYDTNYGGNVGGRGIQVWPDSEHTTIANNLVDNANQWSIIVSGGGGYATGVTQDVVVRDNILTNPVENNVTSAWWGVDPQPGVVVTGNCMFGAPKGDLDFQVWLGKQSYTTSGNIDADPLYTNRSAKDFRLQSGSPCTGKGPASVQPAAVAAPAPAPPAPAPQTTTTTSTTTTTTTTTAAPTPTTTTTTAGTPAPKTVAAAPTPVTTTPSTTTVAPAPAPTAAPAPAPAAPKPSLRLVLRFDRFLHGGITAARTPQNAVNGREITILLERHGNWHVFSHIRSDAHGTFVIRRTLWSRRPALRFRAAIGDGTAFSPTLVLVRGKTPTSFSAQR